MQGTSLKSEMKLVNGQNNASTARSKFPQLRLNDCSTAPNRDEQNFWPRIPPVELNQSKGLAMHQLVQRVKQRRNGENNVVMGKSPMIIKAYRPPRAPYAIQQQSLIKRVMAVRPVFDSDKKKGRNNSYLIPPPKKIRSSAEGHATSKLATTRAEELEMNTWRPELQGQHQPIVLPSAEDRYVQNYKLQMQQAAKLMDGRFHYAQCDTSLQDGYTLNHANPLPPISTSQASQEEYMDDVSEQEKQLSAAPSGIQENTIHLHFTDHNKKSRRGSKKKLQKEKWKVVEGEAYDNNLRTKYKFTNDKRQFKDDLERMRELSAIREDLSILGDRTHKLPSTHSSTSLDRIEENNAINTLDNSVECSHYNELHNDKDTLNGIEQLAENSRIDNEVMEDLHLANNSKEPLHAGDVNEGIEESELISRHNVFHTENIVVPSAGPLGPDSTAITNFSEADNTLINNTTSDIQTQYYVDNVKSKFEQTETKRINENPIEDGYYKFVSTDDTM